MRPPVVGIVQSCANNRSTRSSGMGDWKANFDGGTFKTCYICGHRSVGIFALKAHLQDRHRKHDGPFLCPLCDQAIPDGLGLHRHIQQHLKDQADKSVHRPFRCEADRCQSTFATKKALRQHLPSCAKANGQSRIYQCTEPNCPDGNGGLAFSCSSAKEYSRHMVGVHGKKPFECDKCGGRYMNKVGIPR